MQDWLGLDNGSRMNVPGTVDNNWSWRMDSKMLTEALLEELLTLTKRFGRANWDSLNANKKPKEAESDA